MDGNSTNLEIGAFEAKNTFGTLLDRVERGEEIVITRHGRAVARLVPNVVRIDPQVGQAALERIRDRAAGRRPQVKCVAGVSRLVRPA